ncbi:hypothetical protein DEIGR_102285 [Deinococcus grandis]|uniref:Uncharacterized protein n=1 Tax=Deinococcus grandis TaxID=57498 RepID=A0A100HK63_9DEIO|nr:hypothetical protein DEGR_09720 [Deinococcus grandis]GAQ22258.1 hypothetical protein DEIGR_102285 [Deinococcus grandis]
MAPVTQPGKSPVAVAVHQIVGGDPAVPGHLENLWEGASFSEEGHELGSAPLDGAGAGRVEVPESVGVMRQGSRQECLFDLTIINLLIGVRIRDLEDTPQHL